MEYLFLILFIIIILFLLITKYKLLINNFKDIDNYQYLKKYSSTNFNLDDFKNLLYYNIIDTIYTTDEKITELIINDINKTKFNHNLKKLNNIYLLIKKINENIKIIIFYDGLLHNYNKIIFNENDFTGKELIYKLDLNDKLFSHYLQ